VTFWRVIPLAVEISEIDGFRIVFEATWRLGGMFAWSRSACPSPRSRYGEKKKHNESNTMKAFLGRFRLEVVYCRRGVWLITASTGTH